MFRELAKDPMQNKRLVKRYESDVEKQYNLLVKKVKKDFPDADLETLSAWYLILVSEYINRPVQRQIMNYVRTTAMQGDMSARTNLKTIGFNAAVGVLPVDPKVLDILNQRNIAALKGITDDMAKTFKQEMSEGILRGESVKDLTKRVVDSIGISKNRARTMVRTETAFAFNTARVDQFKKYGVEKVRWFTARDERVCPQCGPLHNKIFNIEDLPPIPLHPNCFLPGTVYESPSNIIGGLRAMYDGEIVQLTVADGRRISVTENHMFLTPNGFAAANLLREGDYVINSSPGERISTTDPYNNHVPSSVDEIFDALSVNGGMLGASVPVSPEYLHSDGRGCDGNIDIVLPNRLLWDAFKSNTPEHIDSDLLNRKDIGRSFPSGGSLNQFFIGALNATDGGMSAIRQSSAFFSGRLAHPEKHGFAAVSLDDTSGIESANYNPPIKTEMLRKLLNAHSGIIESNQIVDIDTRPYHGPVYDFQTINTLCIGNGFVTSNCRCVPLAVVEEVD